MVSVIGGVVTHITVIAVVVVFVIAAVVVETVVAVAVIAIIDVFVRCFCSHMSVLQWRTTFRP